MKLCKTHLVRFLDDESIGIGYVNARFYYSSADENINLVFDKLSPNLAELILAHLTVSYAYSRIGQVFFYLSNSRIYGLNTVVKVVYLTASAKLSFHSLGKYFHIVGHHIALYRMSSHGSNFKHRHISYARHRHIESTGNGRCRKGEYVNIGKLFLELFLLCNTEALLLVNNEQA